MPTFAIIAGIPGSGKSTAAGLLKQNRGFFVVSTDGLRLALNANVYPKNADGEYATLEPVVTEVARVAVRRLLEAGRDVAIDATHLTRAKRAAWVAFAREVVPAVRTEIHWCTGLWDSFERWRDLRKFTLEEYQALQAKIDPKVEEPSAGEADELVFHPYVGPA